MKGVERSEVSLTDDPPKFGIGRERGTVDWNVRGVAVGQAEFLGVG